MDDRVQSQIVKMAGAVCSVFAFASLFVPMFEIVYRRLRMLFRRNPPIGTETSGTARPGTTESPAAEP